MMFIVYPHQRYHKKTLFIKKLEELFLYRNNLQKKFANLQNLKYLLQLNMRFQRRLYRIYTVFLLIFRIPTIERLYVYHDSTLKSSYHKVSGHLCSLILCG